MLKIVASSWRQRDAARERSQADARAADLDADFRELRGRGYEGSYYAVRRYAKAR